MSPSPLRLAAVLGTAMLMGSMVGCGDNASGPDLTSAQASETTAGSPSAVPSFESSRDSYRSVEALTVAADLVVAASVRDVLTTVDDRGGDEENPPIERVVHNVWVDQTLKGSGGNPATIQVLSDPKGTRTWLREGTKATLFLVALTHLDAEVVPSGSTWYVPVGDTPGILDENEGLYSSREADEVVSLLDEPGSGRASSRDGVWTLTQLIRCVASIDEPSASPT